MEKLLSKEKIANSEMFALVCKDQKITLSIGET